MKQLSPTDPVPVLRGDLVFSNRPTGTGAEVIQIRPIGFGQGTRLHGFELSLARMLDGRRSAQDVVNRATRLGLPLSVPALEGFLAFLEQHHLLARTAGEAASAVSPWSQRVEWDPDVRQRYQNAMRALRAGRPDDARRLLDRLLAAAPLHEEARQLRAWLADHPDGIADGLTFNEIYAKTERAWLDQRALQSRPAVAAGTAVQPIPLPGPVSEALEPAELRSVRPSFRPWAWLLALVALTLGALLIPIPMQVSVPAQLTPVTVTGIEAPVRLNISEVNVKEGQWVRPGDTLVTFANGTKLTSEVEGVVSDVTAAPGKPVLAGQQLMEIRDTRQLRVLAHLNGRQARDVRAGQQATIALGQHRAKTTLAAVSGREIVTTIDNTGQQMEPGNAVIDIDVGSRSLLQRMFH